MPLTFPSTQKAMLVTPTPESSMPLSRPLADDPIHFRVEEERLRLEASDALSRTGRSARTLVKDGPLRVTLIALGPGGRLAEHRADGPITIHPVHGTLVVDVLGQRRTLELGDVLALGGGIAHAVESERGAAFLLTVATQERP
jgi:quercetin dioxygenase-like cupin family protein